MPEPVIFIVVLVALPALLLWWLVRRRHKSRLELMLHTAFTTSFVIFLFFWGQYPFVGSYYLRYVLIAVLLWVLFLSFRKFRQLPMQHKAGFLRLLYLGLYVLCSFFFGSLTVLAIKAHFVEKPALELAFPLKGGTYYISIGGSHAVLNLHHKASTPGQKYAIDINQLNVLGSSARTMVPGDVTQHIIFGETVYSPMSGLVVEARDGIRDHALFEIDLQEPAGNYIIIERQGVRVYLLHLMQGSVQVKAGEQVNEGQALGKVGNSGFSTEPHLHLQATLASTDDSTAFTVGMPMLFNGRFLVRNDLFGN